MIEAERKGPSDGTIDSEVVLTVGDTEFVIVSYSYKNEIEVWEADPDPDAQTPKRKLTD